MFFTWMRKMWKIYWSENVVVNVMAILLTCMHKWDYTLLKKLLFKNNKNNKIREIHFLIVQAILNH